MNHTKSDCGIPFLHVNAPQAIALHCLTSACLRTASRARLFPWDYFDQIALMLAAEQFP